jgi:hypothetical protein
MENDSRLRRTLGLRVFFGSSCGKRPFIVEDYIQRHPEYKHWGEVLENMPMNKWTMLHA